jgi:hypothetical protein
MNLEQEISQLQSKISNITLQSGIAYKSINLALRSIESSFIIFSITWEFLQTDVQNDHSTILTQDEYIKSILKFLLDAGLKPFHCTLTIQIENQESVDFENWKFKTKTKNYLKVHKKLKGVNINIQLISTWPTFENNQYVNF